MHEHDHQLAPDDQRALDALLDAGFELGEVPPELRARCERLGALLGVLDGEAPSGAGSGALAARVMDQVAACRMLTEDTLCAADGAALDALIEAGFDASGVTGPLRERATRLDAVGALLTGPGAAASPDLADRAFGLVMLAADRPLAGVESGAVGSNFRWRDAVGIAAMLLVGTSVVIPVFSAAREQQLRGSCTANLGSVASALSSYASTYRDALPVASASFAGGPWWNVNERSPQSNSANLFTLARTGFTRVRDLACPGNQHACHDDPSPGAMDWHSLENISYSYQIMFGAKRPGWHDPSRTAVLADRSPVVLRAMAQQPAIPMENSPNHGRRGQSILFCDGSVQWQSTPELARGDRTDNIWLPWEIEEILRQIGSGETVTLQGKEMPGSEQDAFLAP